MLFLPNLLSVLFSLALSFFAWKNSYSYPGMKSNQAKDAEANSKKSSSRVHLSHRHIIIFESDTEKIWGSYFFAVENPLAEEKAMTLPVMIPKEADDIRIESGLKEAEMSTQKDGKIFISKTFKPGLQLMSIGFSLPLSLFGKDQVSFKAPVDIGEITFASSSKSHLKIYGKNLSPGVPPMLRMGNPYRGWMRTAGLKKGESISLQLGGIPKDRPYLWILAAISFISLLIGAIILLQKKELSEKVA